MKEKTGCDVILITNRNLSSYIIHEHPLHDAYQYLSETHKADYLRTYFMHFYGGGYSDIKYQTGDWKEAFDKFYNSHAYISGYPEVNEDGVACEDVKYAWRELVGNCAYICKPNTPFTQAWYSRMISLLDTKLGQLERHPSRFPQDCKELGGGYPIEWNEMLGRIFHHVCFEFRDRIQQNVPILQFSGYR